MLNIYDFDKTIYKKDSSVSFYFYCLTKKPILIFHLFKLLFFTCLFFVKWIDTKKYKEIFFSYLKYFSDIDVLVESFWKKEQKYIHKWYINQMQESDVIVSASPKFLVEYAINMINPQAKVFATMLNKCNGKISGENCKGNEKVKILNENGITHADASYTDSLSDFPLFDISDKKYLVFGEKVYEFSKQKVPFFTKIKFAFKALRVKHWVKNFLIVLPLFFGGLIDNPDLFIKVICGFFSFSFLSSSIYIINDLKDLKADRSHSKKRKRPIASYMLKTYEGIILSILLVSISSLINYIANGLSVLPWLVLFVYFILNISYSFGLKNVPIIDIFLLAACYLIRLFFGASIVYIAISKWMYLTILSGSLYMGLGKRRSDYLKENNSARVVNRFYSHEFLDKNIYVCMTLCLVFYSLWTLEFYVPSSINYNGIILLATIPLVYMIFMKYSLIIEKDGADGDPVDLVFKNWGLICLVLVYVAMLLIALYFPIKKLVL